MYYIGDKRDLVDNNDYCSVVIYVILQSIILLYISFTKSILCSFVCTQVIITDHEYIYMPV